ncbi:hypothetical protein PENTCL1PPCAC_13935, partial [Pristionchus entomophagus]
MEPQVYLSIEAENCIIIGHRLIFGLSTFFNIVASLCLLKQAPEMQSEMKFYLYLMQVLVFLSDVILDVAIEPITLLPIFGGYCKGVACGWMSISTSLLLTLLILCNIAFCLASCLLCRHQALITGGFKLGTKTNYAIRLGFYIIVVSPIIFGFSTRFDDSESDLLIDEHDLDWMRERGPHIIYKRTFNITTILPLWLFFVS